MKRPQPLLKEFKEKDKWVLDVCCTLCTSRCRSLSKKYTCYPSVEEQIRPEDRWWYVFVWWERLSHPQGPCNLQSAFAFRDLVRTKPKWVKGEPFQGPVKRRGPS